MLYNMDMDILFVRQGEYRKGDAAFPLIADAVRVFSVLNDDNTLSGQSDKNTAGDKHTLNAEGITEDAIRRTAEKRPYCSIPGAPDISVTHSGDIWMCLVSAERCGLDFQYLKDRDIIRIVNRYFTEGEREYIDDHGKDKVGRQSSAGRKGRTSRFFDIWVRREALGKYEGHGLFGNYPDSAPGGRLAGEVYFITGNTEESRRLYVHEITASMLASVGIRPEADFRSVAVTGSENAPVIRLI